MSEERQLNGVWDANRILQDYLHFADKRGRVKKIDMADDSPYGIKLRRFAVAMKAFGKDEVTKGQVPLTPHRNTKV